MHADPAMPPGYDEWGGTHTYMRELLDSFKQHKLHCILITRRSMEQLPANENYNSYCQIIRVSNGDNLPMDKQKLRFYHKQNLKTILEIIQKQESLPIAIHSVYWNSGRLALALSNITGIPYVHSVISNALGRISRGAFEPVDERASYEKEIYDHAKTILCVSDDEKNDLIHFYNVDPQKIIVCGQYISPDFLFPSHDVNGFPIMNSNLSEHLQDDIAANYNKSLKSLESNSHFWVFKAFTYLGRIDVNKGIIQIVEAWYLLYKRYHELCPPLWIAGGSLSEIEEIRKQIVSSIPELNKLEEEHHILWWGYLTTSGLSTILLKSLVLIAHSLYEPGGRVVVEAMAEGIPVIATPNGFAKDSIRDWENGFLVSYGDVRMLAHRMEHFVRQPLLSNCLGLTARESAKNVIYNWNFIYEHLKAYGISVSQKKQSIPIVHDYYKKKLINIYPYTLYALSNEYIAKKFFSLCPEKVISIRNIETGVCTSEMKELTSESNSYIVKHVVQRLATSLFFNPFANNTLSRDPQLHFNIEVNLYRRLKSKNLIGVDPIHKILFMKKLSPYTTENPRYLSNCIEYLYKRENIVSEQEKQIYYNMMSYVCNNSNEIQSKVSKLNENLPLFYFECSGMFDNRLSWEISRFLLEYNQHLFSEDVLLQLYEFCTYFAGIPYSISLDKIRDINLDIEMRHLMTDGHSIHMIDHEKTSIGIIEMDIASLLYNYYCNSEYISIFAFWEKVKEILGGLSIDLKETLCAIAYRLFYNIIVDKVLLMHTDFQAINDINIIKELTETTP